MVWQAGHVQFNQFLSLLLPSVLNFMVPALIMSHYVPATQPKPLEEFVELKRGARRILLLFLLTIASALTFHGWPHLPPVVGRMMCLAYLPFFGYFLRTTLPQSLAKKRARALANNA